MPLWLPGGHELSVPRSAAKAVVAGLERRPYAELATDVMADERDRGLDRERRAGLTRVDELALIDAWRSR